MTKFVLFLALAAPLALLAQTGQNDAWIGTWKLNVEKSKFDPGPAPKSQTVTIEAGRKTTVEGVIGTGENENWSFTPSEGVSVPITGMQNSSVVEKKINDRTYEHDWNMNGSIRHGKAVLSKNGKTVTYTMTGKTSDGKPIHDVDLYEKQ